MSEDSNIHHSTRELIQGLGLEVGHLRENLTAAVGRVEAKVINVEKKVDTHDDALWKDPGVIPFLQSVKRYGRIIVGIEAPVAASTIGLFVQDWQKSDDLEAVATQQSAIQEALSRQQAELQATLGAFANLLVVQREAGKLETEETQKLITEQAQKPITVIVKPPTTIVPKVAPPPAKPAAKPKRDGWFD